MEAAAQVDFATLELKPEHKYILFVDTTRVDIDALPNDLSVDILIVPVIVSGGKSIRDSVLLVDRGAVDQEVQAGGANGISK